MRGMTSWVLIWMDLSGVGGGCLLFSSQEDVDVVVGH